MRVVNNAWFPTPFHYLASKARAFLPSRLDRRLRAVITAVVTPFLWTLKTSHWRSCLAGAPVDANGPVPWYTYPAIHFLQSSDLMGRRVLELGAGNSTLWWASRAAYVCSLESDAEWLARITKQIPINASIHLVTDEVTDRSVAICQESSPYDVIIIDGLDRLGFSRLAHNWLNESGAIILDNSEGFWGGDADGSYPIINHFRELGFQRVDFYGHSPNNSLPSCTSIFFKSSCFLFSPSNAPKML